MATPSSTETHTLSAIVSERANYWATSEVFDSATNREISELLERHDDKELTDRFYRDLEFGTGGLRGILGAGTCRMNIYNVRKATTALALYVLESFGKNSAPKIAVSHDSRHFSREFSKAVCEVMAAHGIKSFITKDMRPVPMLSFLVRQKGCQAGVCVTASHNPPEYNGYKVYWANGAQLVPPHDTAVIQHYGKIQGYDSLRHMPYEEAKKAGLIEEIGEELDQAYFAKVAALSLRQEGRQGFSIVYSPLHGTGGFPVLEALKRFGFDKVAVVEEQRLPNGDFPTVKFPNPEDPAALAMALALGKKLKADLVMATDPDTDRLGMAVREGPGFWFLNGNEMGCLLSEYFLSQMKETGRMPALPMFIKTVVTTELQREIAQHYGVHVEDTLTGFKWICQVIEEYALGTRTPKRQYVCGGEESYGFLAGDFVRDKDGVSACCIAAEMTAFYKSQGLNLKQVLDRIFLRHGVYRESLHTVTLPGKDGADAIKGIMHRMRTSPPTQICGVAVKTLKDFEKDKIYSVTPSGLVDRGPLTFPKSDVLQFLLDDGTKVSIRPSGTEPKIKFYVSVKEALTSSSVAELETRKKRCQERVTEIEQAFVALTH